jgi:hypothetical protein
LGWVEGKNVLVNLRAAEGALNRLTDIASAIFRSEVDVIAMIGAVNMHVCSAAGNSHDLDCVFSYGC